MTQRRMAEVLGVNRKTVVRKLLFLARLSQRHHHKLLREGHFQTSHVQFDEMETFEHTKLKPVTIALAVRGRTGEILSFAVETLCYKGPLAHLAFRKYGPRKHRAAHAVRRTLKKASLCMKPDALLVTDSHPMYPTLIQRELRNVRHLPTLRPRAPLGAKRRNPHDPLFTLSYTQSKLRKDLSRLSRLTWVTTKKLSRLEAHLYLYTAWNNGYRLVG